MAEVSSDLLAILVCPRCKGSLTQTGARLDCSACALGYPIRDGIPVMLVHEAQALAE